MSFLGQGDPLSGLDMPPGDPEVLRQRAAQYDHAAGGLGRSAGRLRAGAAGTVGHAWIGAAATTAGNACDRFANGFDTTARYGADAARALRTCADGWEGARSTYRRARQLADEALDQEHQHRGRQQARVATDQASGDQTALATDKLDAAVGLLWHSPLRAQARALARTAIEDARTASTTCARALTAAADTLSPHPHPQPAQHPHHKSLWERGVDWAEHEGKHAESAILHGLDDVGDWVQDAGSWLKAIAPDLVRETADLLGESLGLLGTVVGGGMMVIGVAEDGTLVLAPAGIVTTAAGAAVAVSGAATYDYYRHKENRDRSDLISKAKGDSASSGGEGARAPGQSGAGSGPGADEAEVEELAKDPDKGYKVDDKSRQEARDGLYLVRKGDVPGPLRRADRNRDWSEAGADFVDGNGNRWDHKMAISGPDWNHSDFLDYLEVRDLHQGENIMLNHEKLGETDFEALRAEIARRGLTDRFRFIP